MRSSMGFPCVLAWLWAVLAVCAGPEVHASSSHEPPGVPAAGLAASEKLADPAQGALNSKQPTPKQRQASHQENGDTEPVIVTLDSKTGFRITANQASIARILKEIAARSDMVIHYSALSEDPISGTCEGQLLGLVLECLMGARINLVARYPARDAPTTPFTPITQRTDQPEEIWVLGINPTRGSYPTPGCTFNGKDKNRADHEPSRGPGVHAALLQIAQLAGNEQLAGLRKQALSLLAAQGKSGDAETDAEIGKALRAALRDEDAEVRAQAVFGLSQRDEPGRAQVLQDAVRDADPDVRLMAVDTVHADNWEEQMILQQALNDADETVKAAASYKLGMLYVDPGP